ncbi:MAG: hypothetical protein ACI9EW_003883 [Cellvibrionaceae bacterium]|jgi:hypothetical protein
MLNMAELTKRSTVYFDPDLHKALKIKAAIDNQSLSEIVNNAVRFALQHQSAKREAPAVVALLQSWMNEPAEDEAKAGLEQSEEMILEALDQDRTSDRKLFPPELKGVTW